MTAPSPELLAAVDLGSNSFRVEIGRVDGNRIVSQSYWKETIRLAGGFDEHGALTPEAQARALGALSRFHERLEGIPRSRIRAVGTQALRAAKNAAEFLPKAVAALGVPIDILSGHEEARLVYRGCIHSLPPSSSRRLILDIGGASTEVVIGKGLDVERCESFRMGCVNTSLRFFADGKITAKRFKKAVISCSALLEEGERTFSSNLYEEAFGSAGTFGAISDVCMALGWSDGVVRREHLQELSRILIEAGDVRKVEFDGLKADRREVIAGGLAVLTAVFETLGISAMRPVRGGLRVGLLYDLLGRVSNQDARDVAVDGMLDALRCDRHQARRVSDLALGFYRALVPNASPETCKLLERSTLLHEVGMAISSSHYHRHSSYIIANADLSGFSRQEQETMAAAALAQRGNLGKVKAMLGSCISEEAVLAVRLAVILAHARTDRLWPNFEAVAVKDGFEVRFPTDWLEAHPLTDYLLQDEAECWAKIGRSVRFSAL